MHPQTRRCGKSRMSTTCLRDNTTTNTNNEAADAASVPYLRQPCRTSAQASSSYPSSLPWSQVKIQQCCAGSVKIQQYCLREVGQDPTIRPSRSYTLQLWFLAPTRSLTQTILPADETNNTNTINTTNTNKSSRGRQVRRCWSKTGHEAQDQPITGRGS
jgi:hypothetical protein